MQTDSVYTTAHTHMHERRRASVACRYCHPGVSEGEDGGAHAGAGEQWSS